MKYNFEDEFDEKFDSDKFGSWVIPIETAKKEIKQFIKQKIDEAVKKREDEIRNYVEGFRQEWVQFKPGRDDYQRGREAESNYIADKILNHLTKKREDELLGIIKGKKKYASEDYKMACDEIITHLKSLQNKE